MTEPMRVFDTGASRTKGDKLSYARALSVQVLERYMQYLRLHRELPDGNKREFDNWKLGIPKENYIDSLMRHTVDTVRKFHDLSVPEDASLEDLCCAVMFNVTGLLFELLVEKSGNRENFTRHNVATTCKRCIECGHFIGTPAEGLSNTCSAGGITADAPVSVCCFEPKRPQ
jgi:hypothetical protein